jgi:hypothetical protein
MKKILILLFVVVTMFTCGSPVQRVGEEKTPEKLQPVEKPQSPVKEEPDVTPAIEPVDDGGLNDWVLIRSVQGEWTINQGKSSYDEYCVFEIVYSKSRDKFDLKLEGYRPKNHTAYKGMSGLMANINIMVASGDSSIVIMKWVKNLVIVKE